MRHVEDLQGKVVGVLSGSMAERALLRRSDLTARSFTEEESLTAALLSGAVDAALVDEEAGLRLSARKGLAALGERYPIGSYRIALSEENAALYALLRDALGELLRDGTAAALERSWQDGDGERVALAAEAASATLTVAVCPTESPWCFYDEAGELTGLEPELTRALCNRLGVGVSFREAEAEKLTYLAESGKVSFSIGRLLEDGSRVLWTEPYASGELMIIVH
ncbi:MAG: transporter substrate-binding domain-containing protein [bacterium]